MTSRLAVFLYIFIVLALGVLLKWEISRARRGRRYRNKDVW
jgi:hypothetical protein